MSLDPDALDTVRSWLAQSLAFEAFCGAADADAALAQIVWIDGPVDESRGHALLAPPRVRMDERASAGGMRGRVTVPVELVWPDPGGADADAWRVFLGHVAAIRKDLVDRQDLRLVLIEDDGETLRLDTSDVPPRGFLHGLLLTLRCAP